MPRMIQFLLLILFAGSVLLALPGQAFAQMNPDADLEEDDDSMIMPLEPLPRGGPRDESVVDLGGPRSRPLDMADVGELEGLYQINWSQRNPSAPAQVTVVQMDTLWDLSEKHLGSPWFWKKVWALNPQVDDPNLIYPGQTVRLLPGEEDLLQIRGNNLEGVLDWNDGGAGGGSQDESRRILGGDANLRRTEGELPLCGRESRYCQRVAGR